MKKRVIIISVIAILIIGIIIAVCVYLNIQENKRLDAESVTIASDLSVEFGEKINVSDFIENLNGTLVEDYEINTETVGKQEITFEYINIKNKTRTYSFNINVIDTVAPMIYMSSSYTVKTGYSKDLTEVLFSGDNADDNPERKIEGEYDFNKQGEYNLTYIVTDASGNQTSKDFTLYVKDDYEVQTSEAETVLLEDVISQYKNDNTKIGIDVSKWQGEINWEEVKNAGVEFVMMRIRISDRF